MTTRSLLLASTVLTTFAWSAAMPAANAATAASPDQRSFQIAQGAPPEPDAKKPPPRKPGAEKKPGGERPPQPGGRPAAPPPKPAAPPPAAKPAPPPPAAKPAAPPPAPKPAAPAPKPAAPAAKPAAPAVKPVAPPPPQAQPKPPAKPQAPAPAQAQPSAPAGAGEGRRNRNGDGNREERRGPNGAPRERGPRPNAAPAPSATPNAAPAAKPSPAAPSPAAPAPKPSPAAPANAPPPTGLQAPPSANQPPPTAAPPNAPPAGLQAPPTANQRPGGPAGAQPAAAAPQRLDEVRQDRREVKEGNRTIIREDNRTIINEGNRTIIRHDETERFRAVSPNARFERRGNDTVTVITRPGGVEVFSVTDDNGHLIRRYRRDRSGREVVFIDNGPSERRDISTYFIPLPPPVINIPRERYIVEAEDANPALLYDTLSAPPVERLDRRYTLDEIRYSPEVRARMPRIDIDTVTFETGSWEIAPDQVQRLAPIAAAINRAVEKNPNEVFLIEGHTDAVGAEVDNLSLSDRRAESVAVALSQQFQVPPENLTTQGYGEQYLKVPTQGPERRNRRVTVRRITPLLSSNNGAPPRR